MAWTNAKQNYHLICGAQNLYKYYQCEPTTYAKETKQLCDNRIYNFKHKGYNKVKCISKELGYKNNRGAHRRWCIPKFGWNISW